MPDVHDNGPPNRSFEFTPQYLQRKRADMPCDCCGKPGQTRLKYLHGVKTYLCGRCLDVIETEQREMRTYAREQLKQAQAQQGASDEQAAQGPR